MGDNPKPKPWTRAEFDAQLMQASKEALKRSRELLESMKGRSDLRAGTAPTNARLAELRSLVNQPAVQEHIAAEAALAARKADRTGKVELADLLWRFVRRTRVRAMKRRLLAGARRQGCRIGADETQRSPPSADFDAPR